MSTGRHGDASRQSACRAGCVPQVRIRPISSPAIEVQNTVSPISSCGVASASTWRSMPMSRKTSIARWLVMCARGVLAVQRYFVIMMFGITSVDSNSAAPAPAGPEPTTTTSVVAVDPRGSCVSAIPTRNSATGSPPSGRRARPTSLASVRAATSPRATSRTSPPGGCVTCHDTPGAQEPITLAQAQHGRSGLGTRALTGPADLAGAAKITAQRASRSYVSSTEPVIFARKFPRRKVPGTGLASNRNHPERMRFMRRIVISAGIGIVAAGMLALPAVSASAAPPPSCAVLPTTCHHHPGPLPKLVNRADLNPQPLPPGLSI